jgi:SAM-dependent methyltransferase
MRETLIPILRCPHCGMDGRWDLDVERRDGREVREGSVTCLGCAGTRRITDGIVDLLESPPDFVSREAAGLERFADRMRADGWGRERVLELPYVPLGYWYAQAMAMQEVLRGDVGGLEFPPGRRILDVGSNTCWASATFAARGLDVVALDIAAHEMQGLRTADWWFDAKDIYFERVLGTMFEPPLAANSFDFIWCCEVLHHNHRSNLRRTLRELARLLKPGGRLMVVNEPTRALRSPKLHPGADVAEFEGHEHAYLRSSYVRAARAAWLDVEVFGPTHFGPLGAETWGVSTRMSTLEGFTVAFTHAVRRNRFLRASYLAWKTYVDGISLRMVATKPSGAAGGAALPEDVGAAAPLEGVCRTVPPDGAGRTAAPDEDGPREAARAERVGS